MTEKPIIQVLCAFATLGLLAACGLAGQSVQDPAERDSFSLDTASEDGTIIHWDAHSGGYRPGSTETMQLTVSNNTGQSWQGRLCVQLLEPGLSPAVFPLAERRIDLEPGAGHDYTLRVVVPIDLLPGTYGLALVVHRPAGPVVDIVSVQVGDGSVQPSTNPWPSEVALRACPPASSGKEPE